MSREIEKYYTRNFGAFDTLTFSDIEYLCDYELGLIYLPTVNYKKKTPKAIPYNPHHEMQDKLKTMLRITIN
jgi:hypothetical protein